MGTVSEELKGRVAEVLRRGRADWCYFARVVLGVTLDPEQEAILRSVQCNKMTSIASGTARGKDYIMAVAALCFLYNTPVFVSGDLIENTKVALTAPTDRQIKNIMMPEIARLHRRMIANGFGFMAGRLSAYDIKTDNEEWFLTGFKADEHNHEAWSGFHAVHTFFGITEASGIHENIYSAIEGNLQGDSRIVLAFNRNTNTGYAARSQKSARWAKFRLNSLNAPNVLQKKIIIPGQVDYGWVADKVETWCHRIDERDFNEGEGDFWWEGACFRPNDLFRIKILALAPNETSDTLIPSHWVELAMERWKQHRAEGFPIPNTLRLGVDVAGMGRDSSCFCPRYGDYVGEMQMVHSAGKANHMEIAGMTVNRISHHNDQFSGKKAKAYIDTIGEGAGVYSRLVELAIPGVFSCKYSESAEDGGGNPLTDVTGQYTFANMRAYLAWAIRDWLDPSKNSKAMLPPDDGLKEELAEVKWKFQSNGKIIIEPKDDIKLRLKRSPDKMDALANTFYPDAQEAITQDLTGMFF